MSSDDLENHLMSHLNFTYHYQISESIKSEERHFKLFHYLNGLNLDVQGRVNFTFDSELNYNNNLITIKFSCSHEIQRISFTVLMIFEYPELYSIDIDEIGYGENSKTELKTENSI